MEANKVNLVEIEGAMGLIFTEAFTEDRQKFQKLIVKKDVDISIGRDANNNICYNSKFVSSEHAHLIYRNKYWTLKDNNSTNGVFVNNKITKGGELNFCDTIYIMGLKIIVCYNFIMINNPDGLINIKEEVFEKEKKDIEVLENEWEDEDFEEEIEKKKEYFYTSPRFKNDIETAEVKVDTPVERWKNATYIYSRAFFNNGRYIISNGCYKSTHNSRKFNRNCCMASNKQKV